MKNKTNYEIDNDIIEFFLNVEQDYLIKLKEKKGYEDLKETLRTISISKLEKIIYNRFEQFERRDLTANQAQRDKAEASIMCEAYAEEVIEQDLQKHDDVVLALRLIELERSRKEKERESIFKKYNDDITKSSLFDRDRIDRIEKRYEYLEIRQKELDEKIKTYRSDTISQKNNNENSKDPIIEV